MNEIKVGRSKVDGCEEKERVCDSVGYPYVGQRMLTFACHYWKEVASHHGIDCEYGVSGLHPYGSCTCP